MPGINNFLPFANSPGANVISDAVYAALTTRGSGFQPGVASSAQFNKVWKQASVMTAALGQLIANNNINASDSDAVATLATNLVTAFMGGNGISPAQFDDSGKVATTTYVMRAVGNYASVLELSSATSLSTTQMGKMVLLDGASYTVSLPDPFAMKAGSCLSFFNKGTGVVTVSCTGAGVAIASGVSSLTSVELSPGDSLILTAKGPGIPLWLMGGSAQARYSTALGDNVGKIEWFAAASTPRGYLAANGAAVSRTAYAALFSKIGTTFGIGDGVSTFNLPDMRDRMPLGSGTSYALGVTGGSKDAIVVSHSHTASTSISDPGHSHGSQYDDRTPSGIDYTGSRSEIAGVGTVWNYPTTVSTTGITASTTVASTGSSGTNANLPPFMALNPCIKY